MPSCPKCLTPLDVNIYSTKNSSTININALDTKENMIRDALLRYWRWVTEGCLEKQYYYDNYHNHIEFVSNDIYKFKIQTFDSPEGDIWLKGKFRVLSFCVIEILEQQTIYK